MEANMVTKKIYWFRCKEPFFLQFPRFIEYVVDTKSSIFIVFM